VLNHGALVDRSRLGTSGLNSDAIAECEDVFEALVLKGVGVNVDDALRAGNARIKKLLVRLAGRVNHSREEVLLDDLAGVYISEGGNLLAVLIVSDLSHLPAEEHLNTTLAALLKSDLIGIAELEDLLVGGPVLDAGVLSSSALKDVLAQEVFVVKSVEIGALTLVREFG
jgi:hypothetical protein